MKDKPIRMATTVKAVKRRDKHVEPEDLHRFVRSELNLKKQKRVRKHLEGCVQCAIRVSRLQLLAHALLEV